MSRRASERLYAEARPARSSARWIGAEGQFRGGLALILVAAMLWGTAGLTSQVLARLAALDALSVGFWRLLIAAPAMLLAARRLGAGTLGPVLRRHGWAIALFGLGVAGYNLCFFAAIPRTSVTATTLLALCSAPLWVALLARLFLHEAITLPVALALVMGLAGTVLLIGGEGGRDLLRTDYAAGNLLALVAGSLYAGYSLVGRAASRSAPPAALVALAFTAAAIFLVPVALAGDVQRPESLPGWLALLYLGLVPTALAYLIYIFGLRRVPATVASIATLVEPLTAALLAAIFLGERLTAVGLAGALLLLGSLGVLVRGDLPGRG